jgi:hypothetical protein
VIGISLLSHAHLIGSDVVTVRVGAVLHDHRVLHPCKPIGWISYDRTFFLRGSVVPFPAGFCYRQVAKLLCLLGTTIIISPTLSLERLHHPMESNPSYVRLTCPPFKIYAFRQCTLMQVEASPSLSMYGSALPGM